MFPHTSVLLHEWLQFLENKTLSVYVDGTLGAGGHAEAVLKAHPEIEHFVGIDQDPSALEMAKGRLEKWKSKLHLFHSNFSHFDEALSTLSIPKADAMLLDLGVSSMQFDRPERGFSFRFEGPLDMRMNPEQDLTAEEVVNTWTEGDLGRIFRDYGEEKRWRQAARTIVHARKIKPLKSTQELVELLYPIFPRTRERSKHPLTLIFQALRICVNRELEVLETALPKAIEALTPGGILGIISFHSLEDRFVKQFFRNEASDKVETSGLGVGLFLSKEPRVKILTSKPLVPSDEEMENNPRARSAKLRVIEKR